MRLEGGGSAGRVRAGESICTKSPRRMGSPRGASHLRWRARSSRNPTRAQQTTPDRQNDAKPPRRATLVGRSDTRWHRVCVTSAQKDGAGRRRQVRVASGVLSSPRRRRQGVRSPRADALSDPRNGRDATPRHIEQGRRLLQDRSSRPRNRPLLFPVKSSVRPVFTSNVWQQPASDQGDEPDYERGPCEPVEAGRCQRSESAVGRDPA